MTKSAQCFDDSLKHQFEKSAGQAVPLDSLVGRFEDGCLELEREITLGGNIGWQDQKWHVFRESGDSVNAGAGSLFDLIISLSPNATDEARSKTKCEL